MRKISIFLLLFFLSANFSAYGNGASRSDTRNAASAGNFTIGLGPIGNFYTTNRRPEMSPGVGALIYFDYRWSPELSTTASMMMQVSSGKDRDFGQNNIIFMGIPTFDVKYYFITNPSKWDPFASVGVGYYVLTNGSIGRGLATGLGAQVGTGFDYYISTKISLGFLGQFRSIAMLGGGSTGSFPVSVAATFGYHF